MTEFIFTSESVTQGHPDKVADQISDAILDAHFSQDPQAHVACETLVTTDTVIVAGEITSNAKVNHEQVIRDTIKEIGYVFEDDHFNYQTVKITNLLHEQSPDINQGVSKEDTGAGDQGLMFGYATNATEELMPLPIVLAHKLTMKLTELRENNTLMYLKADGKSQVSVRYIDGVAKEVTTIVISTHTHKDTDIHTIRHDILEKVIKPVCGAYITDNTQFHINPTGKFEIGGPFGDCGLTGRKIIVDTYGGWAPHGGGAFSGKDPTKVDRSACYAARYIAKNVVKSGIANECLVQLSYAIGVSEPVSILIDTHGTGKLHDDEIAKIVRKQFPIKPRDIIDQLKLRQPIYKKTASYGHFGRDLFPWEQTDKVDAFK